MTYMMKVGNYSSMYLPVQTMEEDQQCFLVTLNEPHVEASVNIVGPKVIGHDSHIQLIQSYLDQMHTGKMRRALENIEDDQEWLVRVMKMEFLWWVSFNQQTGRGNDVYNWSPMKVKLSVDPDNYRSVEFVVVVNDRGHHIYVDLKDKSISGALEWRSLIPIYFARPDVDENTAMENALLIKDVDKVVLENARFAWELRQSDNAPYN